MTYTTEPPHTVLEVSTKHEEETNKGTKPKKARLPCFDPLGPLPCAESFFRNRGKNGHCTAKVFQLAAGTCDKVPSFTARLVDGVPFEDASAENNSYSLSSARFSGRAAGAGPGTNQNTSSLHKTRSRDRSAGPSLRLAAAGCQFGCSKASTKIGAIRDAK